MHSTVLECLNEFLKLTGMLEKKNPTNPPTTPDKMWFIKRVEHNLELHKVKITFKKFVTNIAKLDNQNCQGTF